MNNAVRDGLQMPKHTGELPIGGVSSLLTRQARAPKTMGEGMSIGVLGAEFQGHSAGDYVVWGDGEDSGAVYPAETFTPYLQQLGLTPTLDPIPPIPGGPSASEDSVQDAENDIKKRKRVEAAAEEEARQQAQQYQSRIGGVGAVLAHLVQRFSRPSARMGLPAEQVGYARDLLNATDSLMQLEGAHAIYSQALGTDIIESLNMIRGDDGWGDLEQRLNDNPLYEGAKTNLLGAVAGCPDALQAFGSAQESFEKATQKLAASMTSGTVPEEVMPKVAQFLEHAGEKAAGLTLPTIEQDESGKARIRFNDLLTRLREIIQKLLAKLGLGGGSSPAPA